MDTATTSTLEIGAVAQPSRLIRDFWTLTKPEVNFLIVIATFTGFYLGNASQANPFGYDRLFHALGAQAFNGYALRLNVRLSSAAMVILDLVARVGRRTCHQGARTRIPIRCQAAIQPCHRNSRCGL
jgi:hypothetical protein